MPHADRFSLEFQQLTGYLPFPWQRAMHRRLVDGQFPKHCSLPTGLGKTSVISIWLLALADRVRQQAVGGFPRRLVYVVNRRTIVDQATREVEAWRKALARPDLAPVAEALGVLSARPDRSPLAISTLRGQFADNAEWRDDPARAAVVVGTVDMVGSRLLFSGYGCGFRSKPLHAGFLGQDSLLVHDEAHLEPAFQHLIEAIIDEQRVSGDWRPMRVMALTATSRNGGDVFELTDQDQWHRLVRQRLHAHKVLRFHHASDTRQVVETMLGLALERAPCGGAILVFVRRVDDAERLAAGLRKKGQRVQTLTGTLRGRERDRLATADPMFARFRRASEIARLEGPVYLVCTSAGEVGIDMSADHLVCDLTPFDSMVQRFGRVNRYGEGNARIDVVHSNTAPSTSAKIAPGSADAFEVACARTHALLSCLPSVSDGEHDASPAALGGLPDEDRWGAYTPSPVVLPVSDILFDAWALTSVREPLPGRPSVAEWLHGVADWEPPETQVAWREEVDLFTDDVLASVDLDALFEDYPLKPHELLRDRTERVFEHLKKLAAASPQACVWTMSPEGSLASTTLPALVERGKDALAGCTVILPPSAGGLGFGGDGLPTGLLDGTEAYDESRRDHYDVADDWYTEQGGRRRQRAWEYEPALEGMRSVFTVDVRPSDDTEDELTREEGDDSALVRPRFWRYFVLPRSADDDGSKSARRSQELSDHLERAEQAAARLAGRLGIDGLEGLAIRLAARYHDLGKRRAVWQRAIGNLRYPEVALAKPGGRMMNTRELSHYRHEMGTLLDLDGLPEFREATDEVQELVRHLVAAHHGRARPHFPTEEVFDPEREDARAVDASRSTPARFGRLQRRYGRWGLAYLESVVRAADAWASEEGTL